MDEQILVRREEGWVWHDERVPIGRSFDSPVDAVRAGVEAIRQSVNAGELSAEQAAELAADARFELGANEHHFGSEDAPAIDTLSQLEDELREEA